MSGTSQIQAALSRELKTLSLATKYEKFEEYLDKLGTLPLVEKETKFKEYLEKLDQIFEDTSNIHSIHSIRDDYSQTQYQAKENLVKAILKRTALFAEQYQLEHIFIQHMNFVSNVINIGSGIDGKPLKQVTCANIRIANGFICKNVGNKICGNCRVIFYCSKECQKMHWASHKINCKSDIASKDWRPDYIDEIRTPAFYSNSHLYVSFSAGPPEHLWGNMPAVDIVKIAFNELADGKSSSDYKEPINLLFAASGDLNDIIASVNGLPLDFNQPVNICINDRAERVATRNFIMLYLLAKLGKDAIDAVIQIWYSAALTSEQWIKSVELLSTIIQEDQSKKVCTFEFDKLSICTHFNPQTWACLAAMLISQIDLQTAIDTRNQVMMNPMRKDYRHRYMQSLTPGERICFYDFCHNGILLPYGALNAYHNVPNKFILDPIRGWTMKDSSNPLFGWDELRVAQVKHGTANEDFYGKLFFYLREQMEALVDRLQKFTIKFDFYVDDALKLGQEFKDRKFDRIYTSNISDENYVGINHVLTELRPLLNDNNPHATLITLFMNWLPSIPEPHNKRIMEDIVKKSINKYDRPSSTLQAANLASKMTAKACTEAAALYDHTREFEKYMKKLDANKTAEKVGLRRRMFHKIVPKRIGASMKHDEQNKVLSFEDERERHLLLDVGSHTFLERYVEWEVIA
ncbi:5369_t:CDS:1 [Ambispora leptoticha]|uniref:5369_t:CDS:1 n=1 Tax=Ambispora leptoticha TaxID=144679 RepID=A0A9N9EGR8_9GLOM|nr:5369_t:CDS:1 [Ambispora leptoticha]